MSRVTRTQSHQEKLSRHFSLFSVVSTPHHANDNKIISRNLNFPLAKSPPPLFITCTQRRRWWRWKENLNFSHEKEEKEQRLTLLKYESCSSGSWSQLHGIKAWQTQKRKKKTEQQQSLSFLSEKIYFHFATINLPPWSLVFLYSFLLLILCLLLFISSLSSPLLCAHQAQCRWRSLNLVNEFESESRDLTRGMERKWVK